MGVRERYARLEGMWMYAQNRKLRHAINRAALLKLTFRIGGDSEGWDSGCGTQLPSCPLRMLPNGGDKLKLPLCLKEGFDKKHPGCYILPFCERGVENKGRMDAWRRRARPSTR